jgi:hypothetical protein
MTEKRPLEQSRGEANRYVFWCDAHEQRRGYGSCLYLVEGYEAGTLRPDPDSDCANAMEQGNCAAMKMRAKEKAAGECLFYEPKRPVSDMPLSKREVDRTSPSYIRGWNQVPGTRAKPLPMPGVAPSRISATAEPSPRRKQVSQEIAHVDGDYAGLITEMAADSSLKTKPVAPKPSHKDNHQPTKQSGESMIEMVRRLAARRQNEQ